MEAEAVIGFDSHKDCPGRCCRGRQRSAVGREGRHRETAQEYLASRRELGNSHTEAIRVLKRHLVRLVFALSAPDLAPADGVVEFQLGTIWLQLGEEPTSRSGAEVVTRFGVGDAVAERERLIGEGVKVGSLEHVPDAVDYFDLRDLDGNKLSFNSEL